MGQNQFLETLKSIAKLLDEAKKLREGGFVEAMHKETQARNRLAYVIKHLTAGAV